jgi:dethiobiotin synthetase
VRLLVTGTDTAVGKTLVACSLLQALNARGVRAIGMKPVAAGFDAQGTWEDVERIRAASPIAAPPEDIAPYRLRAPASPHFAAAEEGLAIEEEVVLAALDRLERLADLVVIEGAGGFRVPLSARLDSAGLAAALGAPVVMVVPMRLGCINHALLTAEAIAGRALTLLGWVANCGIDPDYSRVAPTVDTITDRVRSPCIGTLPRLVLGQSGAGHLNIDPILLRLRTP